MVNISQEQFIQVVAYEALWLYKKASFKSLAVLFSRKSEALPYDFVPSEIIAELYPIIENLLVRPKAGYHYNCLLKNDPAYPVKLRDAKEPVELLYYSGEKKLLQQPTVAVIGTRQPSADGLRRTARLVKMLVDDGITIVSGLAKGIDTQAHQTIAT